MAQKGTATLNLNNGSAPIELPVLSGTMGPDVIDIRKLHAQSGMFTYDPGFVSTASNSSTITFIDGDKGILLYRGYPIEQLALHCDFIDVCYLLLHGELPAPEQKKAPAAPTSMPANVCSESVPRRTGLPPSRDLHIRLAATTSIRGATVLRPDIPAGSSR